MDFWFIPENADEEIKSLTVRDFIRHLMVRRIKLACPECGNEDFFTLSDTDGKDSILLIHEVKAINSISDDDKTPFVISTCNNCGYVKLYNAYAVLNTKYEFENNQTFPEESVNKNVSK